MEFLVKISINDVFPSLKFVLRIIASSADPDEMQPHTGIENEKD